MALRFFLRLCDVRTCAGSSFCPQGATLQPLELNGSGWKRCYIINLLALQKNEENDGRFHVLFSLFLFEWKHNRKRMKIADVLETGVWASLEISLLVLCVFFELPLVGGGREELFWGYFVLCLHHCAFSKSAFYPTMSCFRSTVCYLPCGYCAVFTATASSLFIWLRKSFCPQQPI